MARRITLQDRHRDLAQSVTEEPGPGPAHLAPLDDTAQVRLVSLDMDKDTRNLAGSLMHKRKARRN